jgi:hypothetical protein
LTLRGSLEIVQLHTEQLNNKMRTKTLILTAALVAAGALTSMAQSVYSINVVGYTTVTIPSGGGFVLSANALNFPNGTTPTNTLNNILPTVPNNTTKVFAFNPSLGGYNIYTKRATGWAPADGALFNPGTGFFIQNLAATNITVTFSGEVPQGTNTIVYQPGFNCVASQFPLGGLVQTSLGLPAVNNDKVYQWLVGAQGYNILTRRTTGWSGTGGEPTIGVGEGFFYFVGASNTGTNWTSSFTVQ